MEPITTVKGVVRCEESIDRNHTVGPNGTCPHCGRIVIVVGVEALVPYKQVVGLQEES